MAQLKLFGFARKKAQARTAFEHYTRGNDEDDYDATYEDMTRRSLEAILAEVDHALHGDRASASSRCGCSDSTAPHVAEAQRWSQHRLYLRASGHALTPGSGRSWSAGADGAGGDLSGCDAGRVSSTGAGRVSSTGTTVRFDQRADASVDICEEGAGEDEDEEDDEESEVLEDMFQEGLARSAVGQALESEARPTRPAAYVPLHLAEGLGSLAGLAVRGVSCSLRASPESDFAVSAGGWCRRGAATAGCGCGAAACKVTEIVEEVLAIDGLLDEPIAAHRHARAGHVVSSESRAPDAEGDAEIRLANQLGLPPREPALAMRENVVSEIVDSCWRALMPLLSALPRLVARALLDRWAARQPSLRCAVAGAAQASAAQFRAAHTGEAHCALPPARSRLSSTSSSSSQAVLPVRPSELLPRLASPPHVPALSPALADVGFGALTLPHLLPARRYGPAPGVRRHPLKGIAAAPSPSQPSDGSPIGGVRAPSQPSTARQPARRIGDLPPRLQRASCGSFRCSQPPLSLAVPSVPYGGATGVGGRVGSRTERLAMHSVQADRKGRPLASGLVAAPFSAGPCNGSRLLEGAGGGGAGVQSLAVRRIASAPPATDKR